MTALLAILFMLRGLGIPATLDVFSVSAYSDYGITASGAITREGTAACGPSYAFGTVFIVNDRAYVCEDRGGLVTDGHIDLYWPAGEESALQFGRHNLNVVVVTE